MSQEISVDLAIIGAGTAGISAFKEASKITDKIVLIDHGPLGTTCARVGCMPSKALIQVADYFYNRTHFSEIGITGTDNLSINIPEIMAHVRTLRDDFTSGTIKFLESLGERFIIGKAELSDINQIKVNQKKIIAKSIIIATGACPIVPENWKVFSECVLTTENIFEQESFKKKIAVVGGGPIGIELGQALSRLGVEIEIFHSHDFIAALSDPIVNKYLLQYFKKEFPIHLNYQAIVEKEKQSLIVQSGDYSFSAEQAIAAVGQKPNLSTLNLDKLGIKMDGSELPLYDPTTMQVQNLPIYIAGDADKFRPLLHEAADEGRIAGYNAVRKKNHCFVRRTPLMIVFSQPNIAIVGKSFNDLKDTDIIIGEICFESQGRARILSQNKGILRIYADSETGKLLGSEMAAPGGEHLAHLLAHAIQQNMTVFDMLHMPFYHPVLEEGIRSALRHLASQVSNKNHKSFDLAMCE
jgi:dihydrolipoamide dehydrogenase